MFSDLFTFEGRVSRRRYFSLGLALFIIKYNLDRLIAGLILGKAWYPISYFDLPLSGSIDQLSANELLFLSTLAAVSLPFVWIGLALTVRRLADLGWPRWLAFLFFASIVNLVFFLMLSVLPGGAERSWGERPPSFLARYVPCDSQGSALLAVIITGLLIPVLALISTATMHNYGAALFLGAPLYTGLAAALLSSVHLERSAKECVGVALSSVFVGGLLLIAFALEGLICLAMSLPLALPLAALGGYIGYLIQSQLRRTGASSSALSSVVFGLPLLFVFEGLHAREAELREVTTAIVVDASRERVWEHVVTFSELPPPTEFLFKLGIAYPVRATIKGSGVGAIRHCEFSTGPFVEPITVWEAPERLEFSVTSQPVPMHELSPWGKISPPHLDHYLQSERGRFMLEELADGRTRLKGTTWYRNRLWPTSYWYLWSDQLIHKIHERVLGHIKALAE